MVDELQWWYGLPPPLVESILGLSSGESGSLSPWPSNFRVPGPLLSHGLLSLGPFPHLYLILSCRSLPPVLFPPAAYYRWVLPLPLPLSQPVAHFLWAPFQPNHSPCLLLTTTNPTKRDNRKNLPWVGPPQGGPFFSMVP